MRFPNSFNNDIKLEYLSISTIVKDLKLFNLFGNNVKLENSNIFEVV